MGFKILVTGGAGYIGSHLCKALCDEGYEPIILDFLKSHQKDSKIWGNLIKGDLCHESDVEEVFKKFQPHVVIHLASYTSIASSIQNPKQYYENNLKGSINLLNAINKYQTKKLIFASSSALYGNQKSTPLSETTHLNPQNPYAFIKYATENMIQDFSRAYNLSYIHLRLFNVAGINPAVHFKRYDQSNMGFIPLLIQKSLKNETLNVFKSSSATSDGTCIRDFIHIDDVTAAFQASLNVILKQNIQNVFNIGCGHGSSVLEVIDTFKKMHHLPIKYEVSDARKFEASFSVACIKKAQSLLGFNPKFSSLSQIIESEWKYRDQLP